MFHDYFFSSNCDTSNPKTRQHFQTFDRPNMTTTRTSPGIRPVVFGPGDEMALIAKIRRANGYPYCPCRSTVETRRKAEHESYLAACAATHQLNHIDCMSWAARAMVVAAREEVARVATEAVPEFSMTLRDRTRMRKPVYVHSAEIERLCSVEW